MSEVQTAVAVEQTVFVVDDEDSVRSLVLRLLQSKGFVAKGFASAEEFLAGLRPEENGCVLLDVSLPGMSGLDLQQAMRERGMRLPVVFLTGSADVSIATAGMKAGAVDLIQKPFEDETLFESVREALSLDQKRVDEIKAWKDIDERIKTLTPREREVLDHIVAGHANKMVAYVLGTSPRTVEVHRARIMTKMKAESLPELVRVVLLWRSGGSLFGA